MRAVHILRKTLLAVAFGAALAVLAPPGAIGQPRLNTGDATNGRAVAERLCASCHGVAAPAANSTTNPDVMSFPALAKRPGLSAEYLAGRIIIPHPAMPDTSLKVLEIRDVIAYILSLKPAN